MPSIDFASYSFPEKFPSANTVNCNCQNLCEEGKKNPKTMNNRQGMDLTHLGIKAQHNSQLYQWPVSDTLARGDKHFHKIYALKTTFVC